MSELALSTQAPAQNLNQLRDLLPLTGGAAQSYRMFGAMADVTMVLAAIVMDAA